MIYFLVVFILFFLGCGFYLLFIRNLPFEKQLESLAKTSNFAKIIELINKNKVYLERSDAARYYYSKALFVYEHYKDCIMNLTPVFKSGKADSYPFYKDLLWILGFSNYYLGSLKDALYYLIKLLREDPLNKGALMYCAKIYAGAGEYRKALFYYNELKKIDKKNSQIYYEISLCYFLLSEYTEAYEAIKIALELEENNLIYIFTLGVILFLKGNFDKALKVFLELVKKENLPKELLAESYRIIGNIYQKFDNFKFAINYYEEFIKYRNFSQIEYLKDVLYNIAFAYYKDNDLSNGERCFKILFNMDKDYKDINDIILKLDSIKTDSNFIQALSNWSNMIEIKFPIKLIESNILISKNIDLSDIEDELGLSKTKTGFTYSFEQYKEEKYQNWILINQSILKNLGFEEIKIYRDPLDPDKDSGVGIYFIGNKKVGSNVDKYLVKFFRGKTFSEQIIENCLDLIEKLNLTKIAIFYTGTFDMSLLNKFAGNKNIIFFNKNAIKDILSKLK
ncbi:MAG: hypothetical protein N3A58_08555 [Spirochaetes bacterium]|nr:hypothetical protein [Spirochaetota bacterium]